jgi:hypothetical protein
MHCPKCDFELPNGSEDCPACGVIFAKYLHPGSVGATYGGVGGSSPAMPPRTRTPPTVDGSQIVSEIFRLYFSQILQFLLITAVIMLPALAIDHALTSGRVTSPRELMIGLGIVLVFSQLAAASLTFGVLQAMRKRPLSLVGCLMAGVLRVVPVLAVTIVQVVAVGAGLVLLVIPGIILITVVSVAIPAAVDEQPGIMGALSRSAELTKGHRLKVLGVLMVTGVVGVILNLAVAKTIVAVPGITFALASASTIIITALSATTTGVLYYRLRSAYESVAVENLVSAFD